MPKVHTLPAFTDEEFKQAKLLLATQVVSMMGRKLEEGDWSKVYCRAKQIAEATWSNLHIDVNNLGLGVEQKILRCGNLNGKPLKSVCGTTLMHPSLTRSIRIDNLDAPAEEVMKEVFRQYAELIEHRTKQVQESAGDATPDMRIGWLLWEDSLTEFIYFEEPMLAPDPENFTAEWNETPARGARKASKSLWVYDRETGEKRYSITTSAGIKIQPYFDVPPPNDPNLYYFRVQSEPVDSDTILIWVAGSTARALKDAIGSLDKEEISAAIIEMAADGKLAEIAAEGHEDTAQPIAISPEAHEHLMQIGGVSDEHRAQLLLKALV